jgi:putative transposase
LRAGKSLGGPDGVLNMLVKELLEAALEGEEEAHLEADKYTDPGQPNRRNGYTSKTVKSEFGPFPVETSRDRNGTFEPQIIGKWDTQLGTKLEQQILALYARGVSYNDIFSQLEGKVLDFRTLKHQTTA